MIVHKILVLKLVTVFFLVASFQSTTKAARILSVFPIVCKSHFAIGESLSLALAKAGHEVTLVSPFDHKSPVDTMETVQLTGFIELQEGKFHSILVFNGLKVYEKNDPDILQIYPRRK